MARFCGACGAPHAPAARFCASCGAPNPSAALAAAPGGAPGPALPPAGTLALGASGPWDPAPPVTVPLQGGPQNDTAAPPTVPAQAAPPGAPPTPAAGAPAWSAPAGAWPPGTVLPGPAAALTRRRGRSAAAVALAAAVAVTAAGGAGVYAATALGGGGTQPEDVLPATALAFVKVDLDPSAGQKLAAFRLAQKFPDSGVSSEDSLRDDLLASLLDEGDAGTFREHVQPWLGRRAGLAVLPPNPGTPDEPVAVAALQVTDRDEAAAGLAALAEQQRDEGVELAWAFPDGEDYVLLAESQAVVDDALGQPRLAEDDRFERAVDALGGDQIALGWLDIGAVWDAVPEDDRAEALAAEPGLDPGGQVAVGAHVMEDGVEVVGTSLDVTVGSAPELQALLGTPLGRAESEGLITELPEDSLGAFSATGVGEGAARLYHAFADEIDNDIVEAFTSQFGLRLPGDLQAVLGDELAVAVGGDVAAGDPRIDLQVRTQDPARAAELLGDLRDLAADSDPDVAGDLDITTGPTGYRVLYGGPATGPTLGSSDLFRRTVPDAEDSGMTYYVDIRRLLEQSEASDEQLTDEQRRNVAPLRAAGYTATVDEDGNGRFRFRVTVE